MRCKHCGAENNNSSRFCSSCAMPLEQGSNNAVCSNCGSENNVTAKFCGNCSKSLNLKQPTQSRQQATKVQGGKQNEINNKKPIYKRVWFWLLIVFVVIPVGFMFLLGMLFGIANVAMEESLEPGVTRVEKEIQKEIQKEVDKEIESLIAEMEEQEELITEPVVEPEQEILQEPKYVVTVDKIMEELRSNALKASNTYKGEYIELTGVLSTIDSSGKYITLGEISNEWAFITVTCNISSDHMDKVMNFESDQKVTVTGTITSVGEVFGYTLKVDKIK